MGVEEIVGIDEVLVEYAGATEVKKLFVVRSVVGAIVRAVRSLTMSCLWQWIMLSSTGCTHCFSPLLLLHLVSHPLALFGGNIRSKLTKPDQQAH